MTCYKFFYKFNRSYAFLECLKSNIRVNCCFRYHKLRLLWHFQRIEKAIHLKSVLTVSPRNFMSLEEKILKYRQLQEHIKLLEEQKQKIYQEILQSFPKDSQEIFSDNFRLRRYFRLTIRTSLEEARTFDATKTEEFVDKEKIKKLIHQGILVPNVTEASYFFIHERDADLDLK
ncbi:MAG TPA: hypothetical protein VMR37_01765, partial [Rhabdochlamydiaceae bacterium]|nr:hypothetical protein [Rhabdochlamydiaceae bacterium]